MNNEKIKNLLDKYSYNYTEENQKIKVTLDFSHQILIDFSQQNKIIISDKLVHWNFLTGGIAMSLKNAMIYNFVGTILFGFFCLYEATKPNNISYICLYLIYITWIVLFSSFYLVKSESFKQQLINWTSE